LLLYTPCYNIAATGTQPGYFWGSGIEKEGVVFTTPSK